MAARELDVVVIGGGAGGLTAAREAKRRGATVALVQDGPIGGDCTFTGCVPSKTLLAAAARGASFNEAMNAVHRAIGRIAATEDAEVLKAEGIPVISGRGVLRTPTEVDVGGERLRARQIILATGATAAVPPIPRLADVGYLTNESLFSLPELPKRLGVLGGGAVGCELAQGFARLGAEVTLVEALDRLLPHEEPEASSVIADALFDDGVRAYPGARAEQVETPAAEGGSPPSVRLRLADETTLDVDQLLVAVGRKPNTDGLGLHEVGVTTDKRGFIQTDDSLATLVDTIWAIGDVTGRMLFTHAAGRMAFVAVHNALLGTGAFAKHRWQRFSTRAIPWVTFTSPEVGRVGLAEAEAAQQTDGARVAYVPLDRVDRAVTSGETHGFVKLIAGPRRALGNAGGGKLLGATVVAPTGGELIHEPAIAMHTNMFAGRLAQATHAYPSWSMAIQQAAAQFVMTYDGMSARPAEA